VPDTSPKAHSTRRITKIVQSTMSSVLRKSQAKSRSELGVKNSTEAYRRQESGTSRWLRLGDAYVCKNLTYELRYANIVHFFAMNSTDAPRVRSRDC
jgi:hypothetical protein